MVPGAWDPGLPDSTRLALQFEYAADPDRVVIGLDDASAERHRRLTGELSSH
jgi:hypothetical protein